MIDFFVSQLGVKVCELYGFPFGFGNPIVTMFAMMDKTIENDSVFYRCGLYRSTFRTTDFFFVSADNNVIFHKSFFFLK